MLHSYIPVGGYWKNSQGIRVDLTLCIGYSPSLQRTSNIFFCPNLLSLCSGTLISLSDSSFTTVSSAWAHNHSTQPSGHSRVMWSRTGPLWDFSRTMYLDTWREYPCYGLHVCVPPSLYIETPNPQWDNIRRWGVWEIIKVRLHHEGGALMIGWVLL